MMTFLPDLTDPDDIAARVIARILDYEGGIKDVQDGKGLTRFGQTPQWLLNFNLPAPTTRDAAAVNYRQWLEVTRLLALCTADDLLPLVVIDYAVHTTHQRAIRSMQAALHVLPDAVLGRDTQIALGLCHRPTLARTVLADRTRYLGRLITSDPAAHAQFAAGWLDRLATQVDA